MKTNNRVSQLVKSLINEGKTVLGTKWAPDGNWLSGPPEYVDLQRFTKWRASCNLLIALLADMAEPWRNIFAGNSGNKLETAISMQGTLEAIQEAIDNDLLVRFEDLAFAEAFSDLVEQAEYLFDQGYILAAGVILRAVLEERLKRMCSRHGCNPAKARATIADLNTELYKAKVYDKVTFKHVDSMAAIGNDAAHNNQGLQGTDVGRFKQDLISFLERFSA